MKHLLSIPVALLALSACAPTPAPSIAQTPASSSSAITAAPPTDMTGSQSYQRSDGTPTSVTAAPPDNMTGSQAY